MVTRESTPNHSPCWIELFSTDPDASRRFYGELFGWTATEPNADFGGYSNFSLGEHLIGGLMKNDGQSGPDGWNLYLATDDAEADTAKAQANGATVIVPPMQLMELGSMAVLQDNAGAVIGLWQPGTHQGTAVLVEPGAPGWFELFTTDWIKTLDFYKATFDWDIHVIGDSDEFRYATKGKDEQSEAGIMDATLFLPEGTPAHWSVYFTVADADAALAKVVELGGAVVVPVEDTPYGRLATATDVTGAQFKLVQ